jgi:hypothetical protein
VLHCTNVAFDRTAVAEISLFLMVAGAQIVAGTECVARYRPREPTTPS